MPRRVQRGAAVQHAYNNPDVDLTESKTNFFKTNKDVKC